MVAPKCHVVGCDDPTHYACQLRAKGISVAPSATPTRTIGRKGSERHRFNAWERGVAGETRADGSFMPYFSTEQTGEESTWMGVHEQQGKRGEIERIRRDQINGGLIEATEGAST